ncbi:ras-related protein Rab-32-like isoform X2 [Cloeon dipterum]|uniref:ras-related protein Rab-32-like isoform X2 n=1 Tax=Cloeon dipterum TaxID=197152 RepID=UPI00322056EC
MDKSCSTSPDDPGNEPCWQFTRCESPPLLCSELLFKFLIVGEFGVGRFSPTYKITIGADFSLKQLRWNRTTKINLQLWDIAGHERYGYMTRVYYKYAVAAAVVFDVSRMETFQLAHKWIQDIREKVSLPDGSPIPIVLMANKSDLTDGIIQTDVISRYCREYAIGAWFITSAKENVNIDEAMAYLVEQVLEMKAVEATKDSIVLQEPNALDASSTSSPLNRFILNEKPCGCG